MVPDPTAPPPLAEGSDADSDEDETGTGLSLSGGGYRAMLFHLGTLWRLNEAGEIRKLRRISSVSGGSITAGVLAMAWPDLKFDSSGVATAFESTVANPVFGLAGRTIDVAAAVSGLFVFGSVAKRIAAAYDRHLFDGKTLQDLPDAVEGQVPHFVFNATNLQTGVLWRFTKARMGDYKVGYVHDPDEAFSAAVAASSAFPPFLSPLVLKLDAARFKGGKGLDAAFRKRVVLSDGGVYDNLGIQRVWDKCETVLVSDAGGKLEPQVRPGLDWGRHMFRVLNVIDQQVRNRRLIQVVGSLDDGSKKGAYWGIRTDIEDYEVQTLLCPHDQTLLLAQTPTRLKKLSTTHQRRLVNWGYAVCDAALRRRVDPTLPMGAFPFSGEGVG